MPHAVRHYHNAIPAHRRESTTAKISTSGAETDQGAVLIRRPGGWCAWPSSRRCAEFVWSGRRFRTTSAELTRLWAMLPADTDPAQVTVIMEPTRNAWVPLAAWFRRQGATVVLTPPEQSADLRAYYAKHTKSDRLDSRVLARLPLLHPEGLRPELGLGPGQRLRRAVKLRSTLVKRRTATLARLDAQLEILSPAWVGALRSDDQDRAVVPVSLRRPAPGHPPGRSQPDPVFIPTLPRRLGPGQGPGVAGRRGRNPPAVG
ncbi:MAG: hypothetical protein QOJ06_360 [Pseudonocardiales bacterium]|nr:hypothetical protein [Pseudonocardiales bacterium]